MYSLIYLFKYIAITIYKVLHIKTPDFTYLITTNSTMTGQMTAVMSLNYLISTKSLISSVTLN